MKEPRWLVIYPTSHSWSTAGVGFELRHWESRSWMTLLSCSYNQDKADFSTSTPLTFWAGSFSVAVDCPVHCSVPGLSLPASSVSVAPLPTPSYENQKCFQTWPHVPIGKNHPLLKSAPDPYTHTHSHTFLSLKQSLKRRNDNFKNMRLQKIILLCLLTFWNRLTRKCLNIFLYLVSHS